VYRTPHHSHLTQEKFQIWSTACTTTPTGYGGKRSELGLRDNTNRKQFQPLETTATAKERVQTNQSHRQVLQKPMEEQKTPVTAATRIHNICTIIGLDRISHDNRFGRRKNEEGRVDCQQKQEYSTSIGDQDITTATIALGNI